MSERCKYGAECSCDERIRVDIRLRLITPKLRRIAQQLDAVQHGTDESAQLEGIAGEVESLAAAAHLEWINR